MNCIAGLPGPLPAQAVYSWTPLLARILDELCSERGFDAVHIEHLRGAAYGLALREKIPRRNGNPVPMIWDSVDCISRLFEQARTLAPLFGQRLISRFELNRTRDFEKWAINQFSEVCVTSNRDREALLKLAGTPRARRLRPAVLSRRSHLGRFEEDRTEQGASKIHVIANGVDQDYFQGSAGLFHRQEDLVLMSGKMSYHANIAGALHLVRNIMPAVWSELPGIRVRIVGSDPPDCIRKLVDASGKTGRVEVTGYVPDIRPHLQSATIAVAPLTYAVGIQNKALEAMAARIPVVATPCVAASLEARPGTDFLVGTSAADMALQIIRLLRDRGLRAKIGRAGQEYVAAHHTWEQKAAQFLGLYERPVGNRDGR